MGLSFSETMRGHLVDEAGEVHLIDFEIRAEASRLSQALLTGQGRITGVVRARGWGEDAPLEGTIRVSLLRRRRIAYDFHYRDAEGHAYRFRGHKALRLRGLVDSLTHLRGSLERDGAPLASGELRFDLNDLPAFVRGWSRATSLRVLDLEVGAGATAGGPGEPAAGELLTADERQILAAYAEAILVPGRHVPPLSDETMARADDVLAHMPRVLRAGYRGLLRVLDAVALARYQRRFSALGLTQRRAIADRLNSPRGAGRGLTFALSAPLKMAHLSRRDYLDALGVPPAAPAPREVRPRWMANVYAPEELDAETSTPADVVIIGSGAGGAPLAARLAERGLAVAVIEEGRYEGRAALSGEPVARMLRLWRDGAMSVSVGNLPLTIPSGRLVGGSTAINSGTCFPTPEHVLRQWREELGLGDDFTPEAFGRHLESVTRYLRVTPADPALVGDIGAIVAAGAEVMGARTHGPLPRNAPECDAQGVCIFGCPTDAKRSTNVSYIPRALRAGATVFTGLPVTRLLRRGRRVVVVEARGQDRHGAKRVLRVHARAVVVACGALRSPLLLADNGIRSPALGRNLSVHPATGMLAYSPRIEAPWAAIPQGYGVEGLIDSERVRFEGYWGPPMLSAVSVPLIGAELTRWMDRAAHVAQYGFMVRDHNVGSVRRGPGGLPLVRYDVTPDVLRLMQRGAAALAELLLRGGAEEVLAAVGPIGAVRSVAEARRIATLDLRPSDLRAAAFHPLGTCRIGPDPSRAVVDLEHRVHGLDNLYVVDGSTVPTSLGVNPQITIMAMAERAAELIARRLA